MKILVLGSTGMAGHIISLYMQELGYSVETFSRKPFLYCHNIIGDITEFDSVKKIIQNGDYDAVINCIGLLNQFAEQKKELAVLLNSYLPHFLCSVTKNMKTKIIHMSTDCVFSGGRGHYKENDLKDGSTFYDRTKAMGELDDNKNLTFRNSIIGPDMHEQGIGLLNWFMRQEQELSGYTKSIWTGVTTLTLAKSMDQAIQQNLTGLYHLVNNASINKYELLQLFNVNFKKNRLWIKSVDGVCADKSLVNTRQDFNFVVPMYDQMVRELKEWIITHKALYPHYKIK